MRKSIFHESWWLDALAPGSWRDMTSTRGGHVTGYLRFVERREGGFKICEMPQINRFLGPVVAPHPGKPEVRNRAIHSVISELLERVEEYDHVQMTLGTEFNDLVPFVASGYRVEVQPTFLLDCNAPIDGLWSGLRDKTRNVIRRARERLTVSEIVEADHFVDFYRANLGVEDSYFDLSLIAPAFAAAHGHDQGKIIAAVDANGVVHAQVMLIWDDKYVHYFLSTRNKELAHGGAESLLLWTGIELAQSRGLHFDFDGGITTDTRFRFAVAFGGEPANRFEVTRSTPRFQVARVLRRIPRAVVRRIVPRRLRTYLSNGCAARATGAASWPARALRATDKPV